MAVPAAAPPPDWAYFGGHLARAAAAKDGQAASRAALTVHQPAPLPPGPVEVQLAWLIGPGRN